MRVHIVVESLRSLHEAGQASTKFNTKIMPKLLDMTIFPIMGRWINRFSFLSPFACSDTSKIKWHLGTRLQLSIHS